MLFFLKPHVENTTSDELHRKTVEEKKMEDRGAKWKNKDENNNCDNDSNNNGGLGHGLEHRLLKAK